MPVENPTIVDQMKNAIEFIKYLDALMYMPGENPAGVWIANLKSIQQVKKQLIRGESRGENSKSLISLLEKLRHTTNSMDLFAISHEKIAEVERDFHVGKTSSKMMIVSLLTIIIELSAFYQENGMSPTSLAIDACYEAWRIMEFVNNLDSENALVSKLADRVFLRLKKSREWLGCALPISRSETTTFEDAKEALKILADKGKQMANGGCINITGYDSKNWKAIITGNNLYRVCESIQNHSNNLEEMLLIIESSLANVIESSMLKVGEVIMDGCKFRGEAFTEEKLWDAFYPVGMAKGVIQQLPTNFDGF